MPSIPYKAAVVKQLNLINGASVLPQDVLMGGFTPTADPTFGVSNIKGTPTGELADRGKTQVRYHRRTLAELSQFWPAIIRIPKAPTLHEALLRIGQITGVVLTENDVENQPLDFTNGDITVTLTAKPGSNLCTGSKVITLHARKPIELASVWMNQALVRTGVLAGIGDLIGLANAINRRFVEKQSVSWGALRNSNSPFGNSVVTFTGKPEYGYTGTLDLYFNRDSIVDLFPDLYIYSTAPYKGTTLSYIQAFFPQVLDKVLPEQIVDDVVDYGSTGQDVTVPITVKETSLNLTGTTQTHVLWKSGTDFVSLRSLFAQMATKDISVASVSGVFGRTLVQQYYPTSLRSLNIQYATKELTAASVSNVIGRALVQQYYGTSVRSAFAQYAVSDT